MTSSSRPAPVVCRHPAWAGVARWAASALLVGVGTLAHAVPPAHGSVSTLVRLFGHVKAEAGYLAVVGVPPVAAVVYVLT